MIVSVDNLRVEYPTSPAPVVALDEVSFDLHAGERIALIGRSGSGKTSLLRVLSGLIAPTSGHVQVAGHKLGDELPQRAYYKKVGLLFQDHGLVKQLDPVTNALCGTLQAEPPAGALLGFAQKEREHAETLLTEFGLGDRLSVPCKRLSGGEQQRVGIARALLQNPKVLLLDEPVASLDVHWAQHALDRLSLTVEENEGVALVILHDLELAQSWATRALLIHNGALLFDGDPAEACARLRELETSPTPKTQETQTPEPNKAMDPPLMNARAFVGLSILGLIGLYLWALWGINIESSKIFGGPGKALDFLGRMLPPDFSVTGTILTSIIETIQMALLGTTFAAFFALPLAIAAAHNISPWFVRTPARLILNFMRTIPSIIWGLFFVAIVGLGPLPGVLALTFYATGYLGKFFYEGIESIDPGPLHALRTAGASRLQRFRYGVFPQVLPLLTSYTIYMFEYNVRAASILGVVGAGGVGFYLYSYINNFTYERATTALLLLLVLVTVIDAISSRVRARLND